MDETGNIHDNDETTNYDLEEIETTSPEPDEEETMTEPKVYTYRRLGFWESPVVKVGAVVVAIKLVEVLRIFVVHKTRNK